MQLKVSKINPEISHLIHRADSYVNSEGKNPDIGSVISSHEIAIGSKGIWNLNIGDKRALDMLVGQIYVFQLNNEFVYITE